MALDLTSPLNRIVGAVVGLAIFLGFAEVRSCVRGSLAASAHEKRVDEAIAKGVHVKSENVPAQLLDLVPLVERWGYADEDVRERVAEKSSPAQRLQLTMGVADRRADIDRWLGGVTSIAQINEEMVAFHALCEAADEVKRFVETRDWRFTVAMDAGATVAQQYGVEGIPHTVIVGPDGKIAWVRSGYLPDGEKEISDAIQKLLEPPAAAETPAAAVVPSAPAAPAAL